MPVSETTTDPYERLSVLAIEERSLLRRLREINAEQEIQNAACEKLEARRP